MSSASPQQAFDALSKEYLESSLALTPTDATLLGDHRYDGLWPDLSKDGDAQQQRFEEGILGRLEAIPREGLSADARVDAEMLQTQLRYALFARKELRPAELHPLYYTGIIGQGLDPLVNREFGTRETRAQSLASRLDGISAVLGVARARLTRPSKVQTETALHQTAGLLALTEKDLPEQFKDIPAVPAAAGRAAASLRQLPGLPQGRAAAPLGRLVPHRSRAVHCQAALRARRRGESGRAGPERPGAARPDTGGDGRHGEGSLGRGAARGFAPARDRRTPPRLRAPGAGPPGKADADQPEHPRRLAGLAGEGDRVRPVEGPGPGAGRTVEGRRDARVPARRGRGLLRLVGSARAEAGDVLRHLADAVRLAAVESAVVLPASTTSRCSRISPSTRRCPGTTSRSCTATPLRRSCAAVLPAAAPSSRAGRCTASG